MIFSEKRKTIIYCSLMAAVVAVNGLLACSGSGDDDSPSLPTLTFNPMNLTFDAEKGDSKSIQISTSDNWSIIYTPSWLSASSTAGKGNTTVTLTTLSDNNTAEERADEMEIKATSGDEEVVKKFSVKQRPLYENNCYARIMEENMLVMSYGMACVIDYSNNVQYFYYNVYTQSEFNKIKGNDTKIIQEASKSGSAWSRVEIPSSGGVEICYDKCQPNTNYVFVSVCFASNGSNGEIYTKEFMTKSKKEEPIAEITPERVVDEKANGGPCYKWEVKKASGTCDTYYTFACAGEEPFMTMADHKGSFGKYDERDGMLVAWNIWMEHKMDMTTHSTNFNKFNASNTYGREILYQAYRTEKSTQTLPYKNTDKYLQIVTWSVDGEGNYSGLVYDMIYRVENGKIIDGGSIPSLSLNPSSINTGYDKSNWIISVSASGDWTATSSDKWCEIYPTSGNGNGQITLKVSENTGTGSRQAFVTVKLSGSDTKATLTVTQKGKDNKINAGKNNDFGNDKNLGN